MARKPKIPGPIEVPAPHLAEEPKHLPVEEAPQPIDIEDDPDLGEDEGTELQHRVEPEAKQGRGYKRMGLSDLQARCSEIKNWEDWCLYLYRLSPITDQTVAGKNVSITKYAEPIDETRVMHDFGSGGYRIMANKRREDGSWGKGWEAVFDILNMDFPPKVPPGAWMADQRNARWAWAKPKEPGDPATPNPNDPLQLLQKVEDMMDRRDARLRDSMQPKESPLEAVKLGLEMARQNAPQAGASDVITTALLNNMQRQIDSANARADAFEKRLLDAAGNPAHATGPVTIEEQALGFAKVVEAVDKVRPPKGVRGPVPEQEHPGWKLANTFLEGIAPGLNVLIRVGAEKLAGQPAAPQPQRQANRPQQAEQQPAAQQVQQAQPIPSEEVRVVEVPAVLQQHFQLAFEKCMEGESPADFADWLSHGYPAALNELRQIGSEQPPMPWSSGDPAHANDANWGPLEAIMDIARHQPVWKMVLLIPNGEARLTAFVKGVLEWVPNEEEEDESEEGVIQ